MVYPGYPQTVFTQSAAASKVFDSLMRVGKLILAPILPGTGIFMDAHGKTSEAVMLHLCETVFLAVLVCYYL